MTMPSDAPDLLDGEPCGQYIWVHEQGWGHSDTTEAFMGVNIASDNGQASMCWVMLCLMRLVFVFSHCNTKHYVRKAY
jgi:hypothetical protein